MRDVLKKVRLEHFQNHDDTEVEFDAHVTVFCGKTFSGKSALLRALKWVALNRPHGAGFVGDWRKAKFARVTVTTTKGKVSRKKGRGVNDYRVNGKKYKSFGAGKVPDDVRKILNLCPDNFQNQVEAPFLMTRTPGQVAKALNSVVNLGAIDEAHSKAATIVRSASARRDEAKRRLDEARSLQDSLAWAQELSTSFAALDALRESHERLSHRIASVASAIDKATETRRAHLTLSRVKGEADKLIVLGDKGRRLARRLAKVNKRVKKIERLDEQVVEVEGYAALCKFRDDADELARRQSDLEMRVTNAQELTRRLRWLEKALAERKRQLERAGRNRCPLCGQKTSSHSRSLICTSVIERPSPDQQKVIGTRRKQATSRS